MSQRTFLSFVALCAVHVHGSATHNQTAHTGQTTKRQSHKGKIVNHPRTRIMDVRRHFDTDDSQQQQRQWRHQRQTYRSPTYEQILMSRSSRRRSRKYIIERSFDVVCVDVKARHKPKSNGKFTRKTKKLHLRVTYMCIIANRTRHQRILFASNISASNDFSRVLVHWKWQTFFLYFLIQYKSMWVMVMDRILLSCLCGTLMTLTATQTKAETTETEQQAANKNDRRSNFWADENESAHRRCTCPTSIVSPMTVVVMMMTATTATMTIGRRHFCEMRTWTNRQTDKSR